MGTLERSETLTHRLGTDGRLTVKTLSGALRVRGIEGDEARLTVTYRIRATDQAAAERALETGRVIVDRGPGSLEVETPERHLATGLAWLFGGARVGADVAVDVPWGTRIRYETMSGSIEAMALVGDQKYRTVSGSIRLWSLGGLVEACTISGSITLDSGGDLRLRANTVSGGIRVRARRLYSTAISTTSGSIAIVAALDPSGDHRAESISGGTTMTALGGVTAELRAVSGTIVSDVPHRLEGGRGYWRSIVGDGSALFKVNSTSGGLRILAPQPGDYVVAAAAPAQPSVPVRPASPAAGDTSEPSAPASTGDSDATGAATTASASTGSAGATAEPDTDFAAASAESNAEPTETEETWSPDEVDEVSPDRAEEELAVLQALERGEIDVDEAAERLERSRR
jgi:hypothetical protein